MQIIKWVKKYKNNYYYKYIKIIFLSVSYKMDLIIWDTELL